MALRYAGIDYELREVFLGDKPAGMLRASAKGTVPVLCLPEGQVIDESRDIMFWAIGQSDRHAWFPQAQADEVNRWIDVNDNEFKPILDRYKYWDRYPGQNQADYRLLAGDFLRSLEGRLSVHPFLMGDTATLVDVAIFPFVRQWVFVDEEWFDSAPFPYLRNWLKAWLQSSLFLQVMTKYKPWKMGDPLVEVQNHDAPVRLSG